MSNNPFQIEERMWEWLTMRLDRQDQLLADILREARKTNGTIREHEIRLKGVESQERESVEEHRRLVSRRDLWLTAMLLAAVPIVVALVAAHII